MREIGKGGRECKRQGEGEGEGNYYPEIEKIDKIRSQRNEITEHNYESIVEMVVQTRQE